jgi:hypothetical protein
VPLIVALLGTAGLGAFIREIVSAITKVVGGMSARESKRKVDIVQQRDEALTRMNRAWRQVDREAEKRRAALDYAARLRRHLIELGETPEPEPDFGRTITRAELEQLQEKESP